MDDRQPRRFAWRCARRPRPCRAHLQPHPHAGGNQPELDGGQRALSRHCDTDKHGRSGKRASRRGGNGGKRLVSGRRLPHVHSTRVRDSGRQHLRMHRLFTGDVQFQHRLLHGVEWGDGVDGSLLCIHRDISRHTVRQDHMEMGAHQRRGALRRLLLSPARPHRQFRRHPQRRSGERARLLGDCLARRERERPPRDELRRRCGT